MKKLSMLALVLMLVGLAGASVASAASVLNIATHPVGNLTNMAGTGVAAVVNKYSPVQLKVKAVAGPTTWLPMMASREIELGIFTSADAYPAYLGEEAYEKLSGGKGFDIRLAGTGMVLSLGTIVSGNVPAKTMAELKGLKVCGNYANVPSAQVAMTAVLANGGLTWDDVKMVPVPHPGAAVKAVMEGRADAGCQRAGRQERGSFHWPGYFTRGPGQEGQVPSLQLPQTPQGRDGPRVGDRHMDDGRGELYGLSGRYRR